MTKRIVIAAALLAAPMLAHAEPPGLYWGVSFGGYEADLRESGGTADSATNLGGRLGFHLSDFIGIEARGGFDTGGFAGENDTGTTYAAVMARFDLPFEKVNVYFLAGASEVRIDDESVDSDDYDPVAAGIGIELYGSERSAISLEYMNYSDGAYTGVSIGFKRHFNLPSFR